MPNWLLWSVVFLAFLWPDHDVAQEYNSAAFDELAASAAAARQVNDVPRAIQLYGRAVELNPRWPDGWWFLGSLSYGVDDYPAAQAALTRYLELVPNAAPALAMRGLVEFESSQYTQSLNDIERALSLGAANRDRNENILRYHQALLLTRSGKFDAALQVYGLFAKRNAANQELLLSIGLAGLRRPLLPKEVHSGDQAVLMMAGSAAFLFMTGNEAGAQQAFGELFKKFPATANAHYLYGYLLFGTNPDGAAEEFRRELEVSRSNTAAQTMLAWDLLTQDKAVEATQYAERSVEEDPRLPSAQLALGLSLSETGKIKDGIQHLETAVQLEPDNLEIHMALAKAYSKSGRKSDARRERLYCLQTTGNSSGQATHP